MSKNPRADETTVHPATPKATSFRTTIPAFIISQLDIKQGDKMRWKIAGDKLIVEVKKENELNEKPK